MVTEEENNNIEYWENQLEIHKKLYTEAYGARSAVGGVLRARIDGRKREIEAHIDNLRYAKNNIKNSDQQQGHR